jgi:hypothetical protein
MKVLLQLSHASNFGFVIDLINLESKESIKVQKIY